MPDTTHISNGLSYRAIKALLKQFCIAKSPESREESGRAILLALKAAPAPIHLKTAEELTRLRVCPLLVARWLAYDADAHVARVVLAKCSGLSERMLVEMALCKGQVHLEAIATRRGLSEQVSRVLVRRGDDVVLEALARNRTASITAHCRRRMLDRLSRPVRGQPRSAYSLGS